MEGITGKTVEQGWCPKTNQTITGPFLIKKAHHLAKQDGFCCVTECGKTIHLTFEVLNLKENNE